MQIQFPRRIQMGLRPWYGLTLRQLAYLVIAGITAGAIVLFGPVEGNGLLVRVLIGLGIISLGVALAFFRKDGLTAEQWIATQIKFWSRPQKRVWTRGDSATPRDQVAEIAIDQPETLQPNANASGAAYGVEQDVQGFSHVRLLHPTAQAGSTTPAVVVLIDMGATPKLCSEKCREIKAFYEVRSFGKAKFTTIPVAQVQFLSGFRAFRTPVLTV